MKHLFVTREAAQLLTDLGFSEDCIGLWSVTSKKFSIHKSGVNSKWKNVAPTHSQVLEWLAKNHNLEISVYKQIDEVGYCSVMSFVSEEEYFYKTPVLLDYIDALNLGILFTLNYIKNHKND